MKRRSNSTVSSQSSSSNIPTARNKQQKQQQEEALLKLSQIRNTTSRNSSPAPSSTSKSVSRSTTPSRSSNTNIPMTTSSTGKKSITVNPSTPNVSSTKTNSTSVLSPLSNLTNSISKSISMLSPRSSQPASKTPISSQKIATPVPQSGSRQRSNSVSSNSTNKSTSKSNDYIAPDYGIASLSNNTIPSRSPSRESIRSSTPKRTTPNSTTKNQANVVKVDDTTIVPDDTNAESISNHTVTDTVTNVATVPTENTNTLTNIMQLLFSPSKSKPAQPLSVPANSYTIRSSWNATRRAPPGNPQSFADASYPTVPNAGKGTYVNVMDDNNTTKRGRAASQSSTSTVPTTEMNTRHVLGPRAKVLQAKQISRMQLLRGRLVRVTFLGISLALAFLAWTQIIERILNQPIVCLPANSIIEPLCVSSLLCIAPGEYRNYTLSDKSTKLISECSVYECVIHPYNPRYTTINYRTIITEEVNNNNNNDDAASKGLVSIPQELVPSSDTLLSDNTNNFVCSLQVQSSWLELLSYRILILPAEVIRFFVSIFMPTFALRSGGLIETGYITGMIIAFALE